MKKLLFLPTLLLLFSGTTFSQISTDRLPEQGDISIFISANPFLNYAGNLFNNTVNNSAPVIIFSADNPGVVSARWFRAEHNAIRAQIIYGVSRNTIENQNNVNPFARDVTENTSSNLGIGGGYEWGRSRGNLRTFIGAQAAFGFGKINNQKTTDGHTNEVRFETTGGDFMEISLSPVLGGEYYLMQKIAIGAQFTPGLTYRNQKELTRHFQDLDPMVMMGARQQLNMNTSSVGSIYFSFTF